MLARTSSTPEKAARNRAPSEGWSHTQNCLRLGCEKRSYARNEVA